MADPEIRAAIKAEQEEAIRKLGQTQGIGGPLEELIIQGVGNHPELEQYVGLTLGAVAQAQGGKHAVDAMLDLSLAGDLQVEFLTPDRGQNADYMAEAVQSPYVVTGVSDGGAHTKFFTGGSYTTDFLIWLVRETEKITLEEAHYRLSYLPAHAAGFKDRGFLREGAPADVVVYDLKNLKVLPEWAGEVAHDFPGGEWRRVQRSEGYRWTMVNGEVTFEDGRCTGATPGRLLRHGKAD